MYLLDTNVISELTRPAPNPAVLRWFATTPARQIWISSVTLCEIEYGLALLPEGKRREALQVATRDLIGIDFEGRCLPLDARCAAAYGALAASRQRSGRSCSTEDALIAAIALTHRFNLVTRNTRDFLGIAGLYTVDPWLTNV